MAASNSTKTGGRLVTFVRPEDTPSDDLPQTFVDKYVHWASQCTDAPVQYHKATGVTILSVLMTPYLEVRTSYGPTRPNIWMLILAGTTMTRKSTSLNLATRLLDDVTDDWMLATDGSAEGILTELAFRDGKISTFVRDEVTGFMSSVMSRDYLSGLLEAFTQLYDCTSQTRLLRKERIEIKNPYFIFMGGGIKTRMEEIVSMEHIRSGFLPRFLFVTGSTTIDQVRPMRLIDDDEDEDSSKDIESERDELVGELYNIHSYYTAIPVNDSAPTIKIGGIVKAVAPTNSKPVVRRMKSTREFKDRLDKLNYDAMVMGQKSSSPELYTPLYQRLANTVLKVAVLIAGAEFKETMELWHLEKAIRYSQEWIETVTEFATAIEQQPDMDKWERKVDKIVTWVKSVYPNPVSQTDVMQRFRIRKRDIADIEATMHARGIIEISPWPHPVNTPGGKVTYRRIDNAHGNDLRPAPLTAIQREDSYSASPQGYQEEVPEGAHANGRSALRGKRNGVSNRIKLRGKRLTGGEDNHDQEGDEE